MGYSATAKALNRLHHVINAANGKSPRDNDNSNTWKGIGGKNYFFELLPENEDGSVDADVMVFVGENNAREIGKLHINPDGEVARWDGMPKSIIDKTPIAVSSRDYADGGKTNTMTQAEKDAKIATLEKGLKSGAIPANMVSKIEAQIKTLKETKVEAPPPAPKPAPKKEEKKKSNPNREIKIAGKVISKDDIDWCKKVMAAYEEQRDAKRASSQKSANKSHGAKAKDQVADAVNNVVDGTSASTAKAKPTAAAESIVEKLLSFIQSALKANKDIPAAKKKMVSEALAIIKDLLKDFK